MTLRICPHCHLISYDRPKCRRCRVRLTTLDRFSWWRTLRRELHL